MLLISSSLSYNLNKTQPQKTRSSNILFVNIFEKLDKLTPPIFNLILKLSSMLIATWNVNSLRIRLPHVLEWLNKTRVDLLCLQETKMIDKIFPVDSLNEAGYESFYTGQAAYNGVAILVKKGPSVNSSDIILNMPNFEDDQKRLIALTIKGIRFICVYVPNGQTIDSEKYKYKLVWLSKFKKWLQDECKKYQKIAILGDFNIAPENEDVHDPLAWEGQVLVSSKERKAFQDLIALDFVDAFRLFKQSSKTYSWWDYRMLAFRKNKGMRIDHILLNNQLARSCCQTYIDKEPRKAEKPSDHTPVVAKLNLE